MGASPAPLQLLLPLLLLSVLATAAANTDSEDDNGFTLTFVFDSSSSMRDELTQVKQAMQKIFNYMKANHVHEIKNFALVEFNDPYAKLLTITTNAKTYQKSLDKIRVHGGGDCPEMAMKGIELALEKSLPKSYIFVFTDAGAKDYRMQNKVENLIQRKQSKVVFVLTGMCKGGEKEPGYQVYENVALLSNGQVFNLLKKEVTKVLEFIKLDTRKKSVIKAEKVMGKRSFQTPVDPSMPEMTVTITGRGGKIDFRDPSGEKKDGKTILDLQAVQSKQVINPKPGNWTVDVQNISPGRVVITTESNFNFVYGFSLNPTNNMQETAPRPLIGRETALLIQVTNQSNHIHLIDVKIKDSKEKILKTMTLTPVPRKNDSYTAKMFLPPTSVFFLEVSGKDSMNNKVVRVSDSGISPQLPALPIIDVKSELTATLKHPFTLSCHVESLVPFLGSWFKGSENVMLSKIFLQSTQVLYNISKTEMSSGGKYTCKAKNNAGSASKTVTLKIQAPRPSVKTPKTFDLQVNKSGEIPCVVESDADYVVTWTKKGRAGSVQRISGTKFTTKPTGNLVISSAEISDGGEYQCSAVNAFGTAESNILVKVIQPVQVIVESDKLNFKSQEHFQLSCSASGSDPTLTWKKDGIIIPHFDKRLRNLDNKELLLKIEFAQKLDAGIYECEARNKINKASQTLELKYVELPRVKILPSVIPPLVGRQFTIECIVTGAPKPTVSWTKDGKGIFNYFEKVLPNGTLVIPRIFFNHTGEYKCTAENTIGKASSNVIIDVVSPPQFDKDKEDINVEVNENVTLTCNVHGHPEPKVKWERKDGKPISRRFSTHSSCSMILTGAYPEDKGTYVVTASNKFGMQKKLFKLRIIGIVMPVLAYEKSEETSIVGQQKELTCLIEKGNPFPTFTWYKDEKILKTNDTESKILSNGSLLIFYIKPTNEGIYKCEATNGAGKATRSVNLKVYKIPVFYDDQYVELQSRLGESVQLSCKSYGIPKPNITWLKDNKPIIFSPSISLNLEDGSLHIGSTTKENNGTYECIARNIMGQNKRKIDLHIQDPPRISPPSSTEIFTTEGENIPLLCEVQAYPAAEIKWFKNGIPYETDSITYSPNNSSMRLLTDLSSSGEYSCVATNKAGSDQITVNVIVIVPPFFEDDEDDLQARRGENVTLSCDTNAFPPATYYWEKSPSETLPVNNSTFTIENVDERNAGLYYCYASNDAGSAQKAINLKIIVPPSIMAQLPKTHIMTKDSYLRLPCYAEGEPSPTIHWLKNGKPFLSSEDENLLEIVNATEKDAGTYACMATNSEGSDKRIMELKFAG